MKVIICGAGRVGQGIAERLTRERHEITIIDENAERVDEVSTELDVRGVRGHAAHPDVLKRAGAADCDMIIAVTYYDEINMVICQIAHSVFEVPYKVARVREQSYTDPAWKNIFAREGLPIDMVISPEVAVGNSILQRLRTPGAVMSTSFCNEQIKFLGMEVDADSPLLDTPLDQMRGLFPELQARIVAIGRKDSIFAPRSNDVLVANDRAYVSVLNEDSERLVSIFNKKSDGIQNVVIIGGGHVGLYVTKTLEAESKVRIRLVEKSLKQAEKAVNELDRAVVVHGDGMDPDVLADVGASSADFVVSITNDDKTNLLISSLAKRSGARHTLALVNDGNLAPLASDMGVDTVLDPRALTVSQILLRIRRGRFLDLASLEDGTGEVAEGITLASSPLIGSSLDYDDLPEGIVAAAIQRKDEVTIVEPGMSVRADDKLVVFYESPMIHKVETYFRVSPDYF